MGKKLSLFLLSILLFSSNVVFAQNNITQAPVQITKNLFQANLESEIKDSIEEIYGEVYAPDIQKKVLEIANKVIENRPEELKKDDFSRADDWYKDEIIYMFYVDQFGVVTPEKPNQFKDTE